LGGIRLRTKFLLSMVLVSAALTFTTLYVVRRTVERQVRLEILRDLQNSVSAFHNFQQQREVTLERSAALLADLPNVRALMTTHDATTIQDASRGLWKLGGSDLLLLADSSGRVMALQAAHPEISVHEAEEFFPPILSGQQPRHWWYVDGHLYEVFLQDIYFGEAADNRLLGYLVLGYEIDDRVLRDISRVAASEVAFRYGDQVVRSTLTPSQESELKRAAGSQALTASSNAPDQIRLGDERFLATTIDLSSTPSGPLRLSVLKSYDQATAFLTSLNQILLGVGLAALIAGSVLVFLISHTFTRPLRELVNGVRALAQGDYNYPLQPRGRDEVAEVTGAFSRMRTSLQNTQRELIESERLATIGSMASSISHDLRHSLAAIVANAEFLCESNLNAGQREDLYAEIRLAVNQMTELIESLLEFSRTRESLHISYGDVGDAVERAIQIVKAHPEFHDRCINVSSSGATDGWFDFKKLERALQNLLINACEAVQPGRGRVDVHIVRGDHALDVRVSDNGSGISEVVRGRLFDPFVSHGKENGTGMGLTVVQKIVQDHGGDIVVEQTSSTGTTFKMHLPLQPSPESAALVKQPAASRN
jgi:signal transduction histidine kinase